jgi:inosose dehydratase
MESAMGFENSVTRRKFLAGAAAMAALPGELLAATGSAGMTFGCAAITWGDQIEQAIDDISSAGYHGIQLRANAVPMYQDQPSKLVAELAAKKLTLVALSSGNVTGDPAQREEMLALHVGHAKFLRDAGGHYMQVIAANPAARAATDDDRKRCADVMTEIGRKTSELGVTLCMHNHMNSLSERPEQNDVVMAASDPQYVKLLLDVAHCLQGGGDPVKAFEKYHERILFMHFKDVRAKEGGTGYQFVELGRGRVDFPAVYAAMRRHKYRGWVVVELDAVPDADGTPKHSAEISKQYLRDKLGITI